MASFGMRSETLDDKPGVELQFIVGGAKFVEGTPGCQARRFFNGRNTYWITEIVIGAKPLFPVLITPRFKNNCSICSEFTVEHS